MNNSDKNKIFEVEEINKSSYAEVKWLKKVDEYLKHKYVIIFLTFIIVVQFLFIMKGFRFPWRIFYNKDGDFQWLAITAIAAIFTFLGTTVITMRKNKADLVAKARIEWIQEVKKLMFIFLKDVLYYPFKFEEFNKVSRNHPEYNERLNEINELANKIEGNHYLLLLNLSANDDNEELSRRIEDCWKWIKNMRTRWTIQTENGAKVELFKYEITPATNLLVASRDYFKREWNKSKKGK